MQDTQNHNRTEKDSVGERLYRLLAENVADVVWTADMNLRLTYVSPSVVRLRGYTGDETMAQTLEEVLTPPSFVTARQALTEASRESAAARVEPYGSRTMDLEVTCRGGGTVWAETRIRLLRGPDGWPDGLLGVCRDITDRRRTEERLQCSEAKYRSLVEQSGAGIATIDLEGRFTLVNGALCRMMGYTQDEMTSRPFFAFLHPADRGRVRCMFEAGLTSGKDRTSLEFRVRCKDGHVAWLYSAPTSIRVEGVMTGFSAVIIDVTQLKRAQRQLTAHRKELRSLASQLSLAEERERRRIAVGIHDRVSQGLAVCGMKLAALAKASEYAPAGKELGELHSIIRQLTGEVRSLTFELSSPLLYEVGLEAAIGHLTEEFQQQHGIPIDFECTGKPTPMNDDVRVLLFQSVRELLMNVVRHARASRATVRIERQDDSLQITVEDNGIGFDPHRVECARKKNRGFGLFSVRERLHHIGGYGSIESEPGHGTQVALVVPLTRQRVVQRRRART